MSTAALRELMHRTTDLVIAAECIRDRWAESSETRRKELWQTLHKSSDDARELLHTLTEIGFGE